MRTSEEWRVYYAHNAVSLLTVPWEVGPELTDEEREAVIPSLREFQAGESSEGRNLFRYAKRYAERTGDATYPEAIRLFIAEEQRHARDLGRFLESHGVELLKTTPADRVFRFLRRRLGSFEISISVLITAEIIALVYYAALREATGSTVLRRVCDQILRDERAHVDFQAEQLARLRHRWPTPLRWAAVCAQRVLFLGAVLVVWRGHRAALRRGGLTFANYRSSCWREFGTAFRASERAVAVLRRLRTASA